MKADSKASREFHARKLSYSNGYRAGLLRAAEIAQQTASGLEYAHSIAEQSVARNIVQAITAEAGKP